MLKLSAFADEISPDFDEQVRVCKLNGVTHIELRSVNKVNVLDFDPNLRNEIKSKLEAGGLGICSIGSPVGKVAIDRPWSEHFERFKVAVELAHFFAAPLIRVFSYYPTGGEGKGPVEPHREEVMERFLKKVEYVKDLPVTIVHENERGIYGDIGRRCLDLMQTVNHPKLRCAFDFANFALLNENPADNWTLLKPYTAHIHVKDCRYGNITMVPAGQGDGHIPEILMDAYQSGYRGFLTLEPHLKVAGHSHGETGPDLFKVAADALKDVCRQQGIPLAAAA